MTLAALLPQISATILNALMKLSCEVFCNVQSRNHVNGLWLLLILARPNMEFHHNGWNLLRWVVWGVSR